MHLIDTILLSEGILSSVKCKFCLKFTVITKWLQKTLVIFAIDYKGNNMIKCQQCLERKMIFAKYFMATNQIVYEKAN